MNLKNILRKPEEEIEEGEYYIYVIILEAHVKGESQLKIDVKNWKTVLVLNPNPPGSMVIEVGSTKLLRIPYSSRENYEVGGLVTVTKDEKQYRVQTKIMEART